VDLPHKLKVPKEGNTLEGEEVVEDKDKETTLEDKEEADQGANISGDSKVPHKNQVIKSLPEDHQDKEVNMTKEAVVGAVVVGVVTLGGQDLTLDLAHSQVAHLPPQEALQGAITLNQAPVGGVGDIMEGEAVAHIPDILPLHHLKADLPTLVNNLSL
jgi:hypothetical protein